MRLQIGISIKQQQNFILQILYSRLRFLFQQRPISEMGSMLQCHACRSWPSEVAHFDLVFPTEQAGGENKDISFSGALAMCLASRQTILEVQVDLIPVRI